MKRNLIIAGITAIALLTSCQKENINTTGRTVVLNATMEEIDAPASKTSINNTTGAITWNSGDQILAVDEDNNQLTMEVKELKEGGKKAVFEGEVPEGKTFGDIKYAFYPKNKFEVAAGVVTVTPMGTKYLTNLTNQIPSCANVAGGDAQFKNICGIVEMNIEAGDLERDGEDYSKFTLSITAEDDVFGSFTFDPEDFSLTSPTGTDNITLHQSYSGFEGGKYIMILPEYTGKLTINAKNPYSSNYSGSINTANLEIKKGKYITMPTLTISFNPSYKYDFTK